jgi:ParB/RepB/Spo0J family partition protein
MNTNKTERSQDWPPTPPGQSDTTDDPGGGGTRRWCAAPRSPMNSRQRDWHAPQALQMKIRLDDIAIPADRMRALRPEVVDEIAESFGQQQGQLQAIVVRRKPRGGHGYILVSGRHRIEAARKRGWPTIRADVLDGLNADAALLAEIDENLIRADLSPAERAMHQAERKRLYEKLHPETKHGAVGRGRKKSRQLGDSNERYTKNAAKKTGRSERSVQREAERASKIVGLADVVGTTLDEGEELDALAKLPEAAQRDLIERAKRGEKVKARHVANLLRREARERELATATVAASQVLGKKLYGVVYADPPWKFDAYSSTSGLARSPQSHYPCMEIESIASLSVPAGNNCVLFLWSTGPHMPAALAVMTAWGFTYRAQIIWKKEGKQPGTGYWFRNWHELLLVGTRGDVPAPAPGTQEDSVIEAPRGRHSEKPEIFAEMIERLFPNVPRVELFARKARPGWDVWGNEVAATRAA